MVRSKSSATLESSGKKRGAKAVSGKKKKSKIKATGKEILKNCKAIFGIPKKPLAFFSIKKEIKEVKELRREEKLLPKGIKALIYYASVLAAIYFIYFVYAFINPATVFFGQLVEGFAAVVINLLIVLLIVFIIYGLIRRVKWAWYLAIVWFVIGILNSLLSIFVMKYEVFTIVRELIVAFSVLIIAINLLVLWYLFEKKKYFTVKEHAHVYGMKDRFFVYALVCFWTVAILIIFTMAFQSYREKTEIVDSIVNDIQEMNVYEAVEYCNEITESKKDLCYVVVAISMQTSDILRLHEVCKNVQSDFYRYTCYKAKVS